MGYIAGTPQGDVLDGTEDDDQILGLSGDDTLNGLAGIDFLYGQGGDDTLNGGADNDYLFGSSGNDLAHGGSGDDYFEETSGIDALYGEDGDDLFIIHDADGDHIDGGNDTDALYIVLTSLTIGVTIDLSALWSGGIGYVGTSELTNIERIEYAQFAGQGDDTFIIGANYFGDVQFHGYGGSDTLWGGSGNDEIFGGSGNDTLRGEAGDDYLTGDGGNDTLHGGEGEDYLVGGIGNDMLYGDENNDILYGGLGNDQLFGGAGSDIIYTSPGQDTIDAGTGFDAIIISELGTGTIDGGADQDGLNFDLTGILVGVNVDLSNLWNGGTGRIGARTVTGIEQLVDENRGTQDNDHITIGADYLLETFFFAQGGDDVLIGGSGTDHLRA